MEQILLNKEDIVESFFFFISNSLVGFVTLVLIVSSLIKRSSSNLLASWIANIIGTIFHEVSHFLVGKILLAKPTDFSLVPHKVEESGRKYYVLGHVSFSKLNWFNSLPVAMAPLLLLLIAYYVENNYWKLVEYSFWNFIIFTYLLIVFIINAIPSRQDYKVAFDSLFGLLFWVTLITVSICYFEEVQNFIILLLHKIDFYYKMFFN